MPNPFCHAELVTTDLAAAKSFYGALFAWELRDLEMGEAGSYTLIHVGEGTGGGMMQHPMPGTPSYWIPYVLVDDVAATLEKASSLGANVIRTVSEVPNMGSFAIVADPTGATFALWQPKST